MTFEFATATRIVFGAGALRQAAPAAAQMLGAAGTALVVTGVSAERAAPLLAQLEAQRIRPMGFTVAAEPTLDLVRAGTRQAREHDCRLVIGLGGGSALDTGKAIAALLTNDGDPLDYVEVIGHGRPLTALRRNRWTIELGSQLGNGGDGIFILGGRFRGAIEEADERRLRPRHLAAGLEQSARDWRSIGLRRRLFGPLRLRRHLDNRLGGWQRFPGPFGPRGCDMR